MCVSLSLCLCVCVTVCIESQLRFAVVRIHFRFLQRVGNDISDRLELICCLSCSPKQWIRVARRVIEKSQLANCLNMANICVAPNIHQNDSMGAGGVAGHRTEEAAGVSKKTRQKVTVTQDAVIYLFFLYLTNKQASCRQLPEESVTFPETITALGRGVGFFLGSCDIKAAGD